jgi:hypothetical protein
MLKIVEIERVPAKVTREVTNLAQGVVLIDCRLTTDEENEEPLSVPLHWRAGDWSKPPIDIALDAETGHLRSLELILQDEIIEHKTLLSTELADIDIDRGTPIFERTLWSDDERYVDETLMPTLSWGEQNSLLVVLVSPPVRVARTCLVDSSLVFLLNEQNEIIGFRLNQITREEKSTIRWASPLSTGGHKSGPSMPTGLDGKKGKG